MCLFGNACEIFRRDGLTVLVVARTILALSTFEDASKSWNGKLAGKFRLPGEAFVWTGSNREAWTGLSLDKKSLGKLPRLGQVRSTGRLGVLPSKSLPQGGAAQ
jgi:hypothetical protein